ncbi:MAG: hypothetical protein IKP07_03840 [Bacilli bacterium]|nr:hypothetical protein [Bacilli bacterium]
MTEFDNVNEPKEYKPDVSSINENIDVAEKAYKAYMEEVRKLPSNLLDDLNRSYLSLERSISAVPKDILLKFVKGFEEITDNLPGVYLNQNDFGKSNYSFIIEKLKIYYDFFTTVPYQMINNVLVAYDEYSKYYKLLPEGCLDDLVMTYKDCKNVISKLPNDVIKSLGYDKVNSVFLDRVLLYQDSENLLLSNLKSEDIYNNDRYIISSSDVVDGHVVNIPAMSKEDFVNLTTSLGSVEKANEVCRDYIKTIYRSVARVNENLDSDIVLLKNMKVNMELSPMFIGLDDNKKKNIMYMLSDQISKRVYLESTMSQDLKYGWNQLDGNLGSSLEENDDTDYFTKYQNISEIANKYNDYFKDLLPILQIVRKIKEMGYVIN